MRPGYRSEYWKEFHSARDKLKREFAAKMNVPLSKVRYANKTLSVLSEEEYAAKMAKGRESARRRRINPPKSKIAKLASYYQMSMWTSAKSRAAKKGLEFSIEPEDIIIPDRCPVFNKPFSTARSKDKSFSPSLDRLDNSKGYTKDNIRVISVRANTLKRDATLSEMRQLYSWFVAELAKASRAADTSIVTQA